MAAGASDFALGAAGAVFAAAGAVSAGGYYPNDIDSNPDSAEKIIEQGFYLGFRTADAREQAVRAIDQAQNIRSYEAFSGALSSGESETFPEILSRRPLISATKLSILVSSGSLFSTFSIWKLISLKLTHYLTD